MYTVHVSWVLWLLIVTLFGIHRTGDIIISSFDICDSFVRTLKVPHEVYSPRYGRILYCLEV